MRAASRIALPCMLLLAAACGDEDEPVDMGSPDMGMKPDMGTPDMGEMDMGTPDMGQPEVAFTLQLLHFADIDGNEATALDAVDEFSAVVDGLRNDATHGEHTIVVSSGDNLIPGPRWFAAENSAVRAISGSNEPGHADHYIMNHLGVVASALGNHDLDQGPGEFADSLASKSSGGVTFPGTEFPYLAANVDFSAESDLSVGTEGADYSSLGGGVAKSATVQVGGETIGLVGVSTPELPSITTTGGLLIEGSLTDIAALAAAVQPTIDALVAAGVNKIVVLAHLQQIMYEKALAAELRDVDIIVAGGSNTRMGDSTDTLFPGDEAFAETYPFQTTGEDGQPLLIVNTDADFKYLGRLVVGFTEAGVLIPSSVDPMVSGAYAATAEVASAVGGTAIPEIVAMRDAIRGVILSQYDNVIGHTSVFLEGRRGFVRTEETNLGNLTADANKWYAEQCAEITGKVLSLKNGGGLRAEIGNVIVAGGTTTLTPPSNDGLSAEPGDVSEGHLRGTLRFDNGLVVLDVSGEELKILLEHGVTQTGPGATPGRFPQVGGMWFGYDVDGTVQVIAADGKTVETAGTRITDLYVDTTGDDRPDTALYVGGVAQPEAMDTYPLVTLNFLAGGGDDYPFGVLSAANRRQLYEGVGFGDPDEGMDGIPDFPVLTNCDPGAQSDFSSTGGEQDALAEYMLTLYPNSDMAYSTAETPKAMDRRIQDLGVITNFVTP